MQQDIVLLDFAIKSKSFAMVRICLWMGGCADAPFVNAYVSLQTISNTSVGDFRISRAQFVISCTPQLATKQTSAKQFPFCERWIRMSVNRSTIEVGQNRPNLCVHIVRVTYSSGAYDELIDKSTHPVVKVLFREFEELED
jgi:hypothetical protein